MADHPELQTIRDLVRYATSKFNEHSLFFGHGTDNSWDEAIALILHTLHLPHRMFLSVVDTRLTEEEKDKIFDLIDERISRRIPVPYLTNEAWFAGLSFYVDERVLIPRSPTAELIENQFQPWIHPENVSNILDLCTGSACIAIACAYAFPEAQVDAVDISNDALAVAKINTLRHNTEDQVHLIQSDLFTNLENKKYDIIITNPPYVSTEEMNILPEEYQHEPVSALEAGNDGLDFVDTILKEAGKHLTKHGVLVVEVGNSETTIVEKYPHIPFIWAEFERGGDGVFILTKDQIDEAFTTA